MFYSQDRHKFRQTFIDSWKKYQAHKSLSAMEKILIAVIIEHPEYQSQLKKKFLDREYDNESNPFLHMSMHITLHEQLQTNHPEGITQLYKDIKIRFGKNAHQAEHAMIECLANSLWHAQKNNNMPDDSKYLACLQTLAKQKQ